MNRELIEKAYKNGNIKLVDDFGIRCKIGDYSFYFDGGEAENYEWLSEYITDHTDDEIIDAIYNVLKDERTAEDNGIYEDEYGYYVAVLHEII